MAAKVNGLKLVACYQPLWDNGAESLERYRRELDTHVATTNSKEWLIIGGENNAHMGCGPSYPFDDRTVGSYSLNRRDESRKDLLEWCESNNMCWAD